MVLTKKEARDRLKELDDDEALEQATSVKAPKARPKAASKLKTSKAKIVEEEEEVEEEVEEKPKAPKAKNAKTVEEEVEEKPKPKAPKAKKAKIVEEEEEVEEEVEEKPKISKAKAPKAKAAEPKAPKAKAAEPKPKAPKAKKATKVRDGWEKGKKEYTIENIEGLGDCPEFDSSLIPSTVRGENPSGAAKKVFTQIRKVVKDQHPDEEILPFYRLTLLETPPIKGEGRFVYDAQTIKLEEPKERRIESGNGKTSVIPIYFEYKVKAVKEANDEEKKGAAKKAKGSAKGSAKNAKVKPDVNLEHYKKAVETSVPEDEPEHNEVSEEVIPVPKKAPKGAPKASAKGKL
jgi:hypothetical protein